MASETQTGFPTLQGHQYLSLITFRKNGTPVPTPVWFAEREGHLLIYTVSTSGKMKRLRANQRVQVAPCKAQGELLGPYVDGRCRILSPAEGAEADRLITRKYGFMKRVLDLFARFRPTPRAYLEVSPE